MSATKTSVVCDLKSGPAEVSGRARVKTKILNSPWSTRNCVYYQFHVEIYHSSEGGYWETYIDDKAPSSFLVEDKTGVIEILVGDGKMDLEVDRHAESGFGNDAPSQLKDLLKNKYDKDTQGLIFNKTLRYKETYLEAGDEVYVFGQASQDYDGSWIMRQGQMPLIVSERGELDVESETEDASKFSITIISAIIAIGSAVVFVVSKL